MDDFAHLQACVTGANTPQADEACLDAMLDGDGYVNSSDVAIFVGCMTGSHIIVDPACAD